MKVQFNTIKNISFNKTNLKDNKQNTQQNQQNFKETNLNLHPNFTANKINVSVERLNTEAFISMFLNEKDPIKSARMLLKRYPELTMLTGDVNATPEGNGVSSSNSPSEAIFGKKHVELDRTLVGIECLKQVIKGDYKGFTKCQKDGVKLSKKSFEDLRKTTLEVLTSYDDINTMIVYTAINDLGKVKSFVENVEEKTGQKTTDHDEALLLALKTMPETMPSFDKLHPYDKKNISYALMTQFNLAQFAQAECTEGNLCGLKNMTETEKNLYVIHTFFDVAGAAGHVNPNGSLVMTEPVYRGYSHAIEAIKDSDFDSEKAMYDKFLKAKAKDLNMPFESDKDRALVKLATMARAQNQEDVELVQNAFNKIPRVDQGRLIEELNFDGINKGAVLLYYSPALIQNVLSNTETDKKEDVLSETFLLLSCIYFDNHDYDKFGEVPHKGVRTVSLAGVAQAAKENRNPDFSVLLDAYSKSRPKH